MTRKLLGIFIGVLAILVFIGLLLPSSVQVERSRILDHSPEVIFAVLNDLHHAPQWLPWLHEQNEVRWRLESAPEDGSLLLRWWEEGRSGELRVSQLQIIEREPFSSLQMRMRLGSNEFDSWLRIVPAEEGQKVTWGMQAQFGRMDLVGRYLGLMLPGLVGRSHAQGLEALDKYLDSARGQVPPPPMPQLIRGSGGQV